MNTTRSALETVRAMYAAFGRGGILAVLAPLHSDVDWRINVDNSAPRAAQVPFFRPFRGAVDVAAFFALLGRDLEFHSFEPKSFFGTERDVVACVQMELTVRTTARRLRLESLHRFTFTPGGQVIAFREYSDTLALSAAWTPP